MRVRLWARGAATMAVLAGAGCASVGAGGLAAEASSAAAGRVHPLAGRVALAGRPELAPAAVAWAQLEERLLAADLLLLGETHDDPEHHRLQAQVLDFLLRRGARPALVFEMMDADQQGLLDRLTAEAGWRPEEVFAQLAWPRRGWANTDDYRPLLAMASAHRLPVVAANLARAQMRDLFAHGGSQWPWAEQLRMGLVPPLSEGQRQHLWEDLRLAHGGGVRPPTLAKMAAIQQSRDGQFARCLAAAALGARGARPGLGPRAVLIAGRDHTRLDRGVPWHLAGSWPGLRTLSVAFLAAVPGEEAPAEVPELALHDAIVWTPPRTAGVPAAKS